MPSRISSHSRRPVPIASSRRVFARSCPVLAESPDPAVDDRQRVEAGERALQKIQGGVGNQQVPSRRTEIPDRERGERDDAGHDAHDFVLHGRYTADDGIRHTEDDPSDVGSEIRESSGGAKGKMGGG